MRLVKVITELRFSSRIKLLKPYEELNLAILGEEPKQPEKWLTPSLTLDKKERKTRTIIEAKRCAVSLEETPNTGHCVQAIAQIFQNIDKILGIPPSARIGVRSIWIEPYEGKFKDLLSIYKTQIYSSNVLRDEATDVCIILDFQNEEGKIHLVTGPMEEKQLKEQYLTFEQENMPNVFVFSDIDFSIVKDTSYSHRFLSSFIRQGIEHGMERTQQFIDILGVRNE